VLSVAQHHAVEASHASADLMRRAGDATARWLASRLDRSHAVLCLAGPGNNGGDALATATALRAMGRRADVVLIGEAAQLPADAAQALRRFHEGGSVATELPSTTDAVWIVDGLFGIGLGRPIVDRFAAAVEWTKHQRAQGRRVLALDVPSGIDADTGAILGEQAVTADATLTFIAAKAGLFTGPAVDFAGEVWIDDLGLSPLTSDPSLALFDAEAAARTSPVRPRTAHKGLQGDVAIIGGAFGMIGAALLAARAALRAGAGRVRIGWTTEAAPTFDPVTPELIFDDLAPLLRRRLHAACIGCGMGSGGWAAQALRSAIALNVPVVFDADALNLLAESAEQTSLFQRRKAPSILTPHPAEAARLLGTDARSVNADRIRAARDLARGYGAFVVLKGAGSVIAAPDGRTSINLTGNPLLATAGTGDILTGIVGALLAQGLEPWDAARVAVAWHGACADRLAARGVRRAVAGDLLPELSMLA